MKNLKETLSVTSNKSARTFTIRRTYSDGSMVKYRTTPMSQEEFDIETQNTENDWKQFLNTDGYYKV